MKKLNIYFNANLININSLKNNMSKIAEIVNYLRSNTRIPNNSVFIFTGLLLEDKIYAETNNIYDFLMLNLQNIQDLNIFELDNFFVKNNMYKKTYYPKNKSIKSIKSNKSIKLIKSI
jgi:hypothetical protein